MEPPAQLPGADLTPAMYGAIGYIVLAFGHWAAKNGLPYLKETLGMVSARDKEIAHAAKEGPIMVLDRVERELKETNERYERVIKELKDNYSQVMSELKEVRKQHHDCEKNHAALQAELTYLKSELEELKGQ